MKKLLTGIVLTLAFYSANAQANAKSLLGELPPIPENVCTESSDSMENFEKAIRAVEIKIEALQLQEKNMKEEAEERIGFNQSIFQNPTAEAKLTSLGSEIEQHQLKVNNAYGKFIESKIAEVEKIGLSFYQRSSNLSQEYWEVKRNDGNTKPIQDKIRAFLQFRCDTLSPIQLKNIKTAHGLLLTFWETYERMNSIQDESGQICFTGYPCSTQNGGFLLDGIKLYMEELRKAYDWHPSNAIMDELGVGSE